MSAVAVPRRTSAERVMIEYLRSEAWRFDDPAETERAFVAALGVPGSLNPFQINVAYEFCCLQPMVHRLFEFGDSIGSKHLWFDKGMYKRDSVINIGSLAFNAMLCADRFDPESPRLIMKGVWNTPNGATEATETEPLDIPIVLNVWRDQAKVVRESWGGWAFSTSIPTMIRQALDLGQEDSEAMQKAVGSVLPLACEALLRVIWLNECEARDALTFGPVSDRRLPTDPAKSVMALRRFAEQQPELRKVPSLIHVAPREPEGWMRPKLYARASHADVDMSQVRTVAADALANRRYMHDHVAVIEVDRKPIRKVVLAPELHDREYNLTYLNALIEHEKGWFSTEVIVGMPDEEDKPLVGVVTPFQSYSWRGLPEAERNGYVHSEFAGLPVDHSVIAIVVAAWRDLIVANVREQQYESTVEREVKAKSGRRADRKAKRGHVRVVRYLPRTVVIRREEEANRIASAHGPKRLTRPYRVGVFAKMLREGTHRSPEANDFALEIGMPLRDDQTIVRPHIRGGTEEEREALLAQDDVRTWRSWAAVDLVFATRTRGAVE